MSAAACHKRPRVFRGTINQIALIRLLLVELPIKIMLTDDRVDLLNDADLHDELLKYGFANIPVTETTRHILKNKLKKQIKKERHKNDRYTSNRTSLYNNDEEDLISSGRNPGTNRIKQRTNSFNNEKTTSAIRNKRNTRCFYESPELITYSHPSSKMCVPPPVLASESDSEGEHFNFNSYPKICTFNNPIDSSKYITSNGINFDSVGDGGVVSRLLSLRGSTLHRKYKSKMFSTDESKIPKVGSGEKKFFFRMFANIKMHVKTKSIFSQLLIPYILICTFIVFLILIALVYMLRKYERGLIDESTTKYELCDENVYMSPPTLCINSDLLKGALDTNKRLVKMLEERAKIHYCMDKHKSPIVHLNDVFHNLHNDSKSLSLEIMPREVIAALYLIASNPQWKINILNAQGNSVSLRDFQLKTDEVINFILAKPNLPLKCVLFTKLQRFLVILGSLSVLGVIIWLIFFCIQHIKTKNRNKIMAAEQLSKKIVYELMRQSTQIQNGMNAELPIDFLKNQLIPINEQKQSEWAWNEALRMVQKKDNRILFGVMMRNGKEVQTVSWNENAAEAKDITSKKKWQSPAFDNSNKIANPPTPCLKIRHMFDSTEVNNSNLKQLIVDAIFEKVGNHCKICDIQLDKQSCCVYLRCASEVDAGIVHNNINGWWFDKRLISIKFLRLERYLSRFPQSSNQPKRFSTPNLLNVQQRS